MTNDLKKVEDFIICKIDDEGEISTKDCLEEYSALSKIYSDNQLCDTVFRLLEKYGANKFDTEIKFHRDFNHPELWIRIKTKKYSSCELYILNISSGFLEKIILKNKEKNFMNLATVMVCFKQMMQLKNLYDGFSDDFKLLFELGEGI